MAAPPAPRKPQGGFVDPLTLMFLGVGAIAVAFFKHPDYAKIGAALKMPAAAVQSAWKWSKLRGLPFSWVLATIIVESGGNPRSSGDAGGRSKGLMQVNTVAHAQELANAGVRPDDMFNVDTGIDWGTRVMKDIYGKVLDVVKAHPTPAPKDVVMRLSYKGPSTVAAAIKRGQNPTTIDWAPEAIVRWRKALAQVKATGVSIVT